MLARKRSCALCWVPSRASGREAGSPRGRKSSKRAVAIGLCGLLWILGSPEKTASAKNASGLGDASAVRAGMRSDRTPNFSPMTAVGKISHKRVLPYPIEHVWPTAVRYLRVDRGYTIVDRDPESGYILFDFQLSGGTVGHGAVELFSSSDPRGRPGAHVHVSTDAGPAHLPFTLLEGIAKKIKSERGPPQPPAQPAPKPTNPPEAMPDPDDHSPPPMPPGIDPKELRIRH